MGEVLGWGVLDVVHQFYPAVGEEEFHRRELCLLPQGSRWDLIAKGEATVFPKRGG